MLSSQLEPNVRQKYQVGILLSYQNLYRKKVYFLYLV